MACSHKSPSSGVQRACICLQCISDRQARHENRMLSESRELENRMESMSMESNRSFNVINDRQASLENRMVTIYKSIDRAEQAGQAAQAACQFFRNNNIENRLSVVADGLHEGRRDLASWKAQLDSTNDQLASLQKRIDVIEMKTNLQITSAMQAVVSHFGLYDKSTKEQIAGVLQALEAQEQTARELAAIVDYRQKHMESMSMESNRSFNVINDRQASLENRMESIEKSIDRAEQAGQAAQAAYQFFRNNNIENRLSAVADGIYEGSRDLASWKAQLASTNDQLASLQKRIDVIEMQTKVQITSAMQAVVSDFGLYDKRHAEALENRAEALEKSTKEQIAGVLQEVQEHTARELAASANCRQASFENCMESIEIADGSAADVDSEPEWSWAGL